MAKKPTPDVELLTSLREHLTKLSDLVPTLTAPASRKVRIAIDEVQENLKELRDSVPGPKISAKKKINIARNEVLERLQDLHDLAPGPASSVTKDVRVALDKIREEVSISYGRLDAIQEPTSLFDPANPATAGRLVALALLAQERTPLEFIAPSYGSGVYALYYIGKHPLYASVSCTETPIYAGKADPAQTVAATAREQGVTLYRRLTDHRKSIRSVESYEGEKITEPLLISDFECRRLVTATNAQLAAEQHLINLFKPVWNKKTNVCWGNSMHGDQTGRINSRPPWHTIHRGVDWALRDIKDARPAEQIFEDVHSHFENNPPLMNLDEIIREFFKAFAQAPIIADSPVEDIPSDAADTSVKFIDSDVSENENEYDE